jgi:hypothetical protein
MLTSFQCDFHLFNYFYYFYSFFHLQDTDEYTTEKHRISVEGVTKVLKGRMLEKDIGILIKNVINVIWNLKRCYKKKRFILFHFILFRIIILDETITFFFLKI